MGQGKIVVELKATYKSKQKVGSIEKKYLLLRNATPLGIVTNSEIYPQKYKVIYGKA